MLSVAKGFEGANGFPFVGRVVVINSPNSHLSMTHQPLSVELQRYGNHISTDSNDIIIFQNTCKEKQQSCDFYETINRGHTDTHGNLSEREREKRQFY